MRYDTTQITELAHFILGIDVNMLTGRVESTSQYAAIAAKSENFNDFYHQYQPLILDEVMATLQTAVNKFESKNKIKVSLQEKDRVKHYADENVTMLHLANDNRIQCDDLGSFNFIVGIININSARYIAILNIYFKEYQIVLKGDISDVKSGLSHFEFSPLSSLVNIDRMYNVCVEKPQNDLLQKVMRASVNLWPVIEKPSEQNAGLEHLNTEQKKAVNGFIEGEEGVYLLQGPPGTGKTTTIVSLIQQLAQKNEHILVCAPSNKAVQVLADKTLKSLPDVPMLLIAVESKITSQNLQGISYENWDKRHTLKLKTLLSEIDIAPHLSRNRMEAKTLNDIIDTQTLIKFIADVTDKSKIIGNIIKYGSRYIKAMTIEQREPLIQLAVKELESYLINLSQLQKSLSVFDFPSLPGKERADEFSNVKLKEIDKLIINISNQYNAMHAFISYQLIKYFPTDQKQLFQRAQILFCTLSIAGRMSLRRLAENQNWSFQTLIIDEAGQAVEAEALIPFRLAIDAKKALLVGDTRQLPATTVGVTAKDTHFDHSMMWRLIEENKQPYHSLMVQYRMKENIRHFPSNRYYNGKLIDHASILTRASNLPIHMRPREGIKYWVDINHQEERAGLSYCNRKEAESIVTLIEEIRKSDTQSHIGVISFYNAQVNLIRNLLKNKKTSNSKLDPETITVHSVDGFQGDEKDIIIVSFVRANQQSHIGFLSDFRRLNVAITRAKDVLYIFGSVSTFSKAMHSEIQGLLSYLTEAKAVKSFHEVMLHVANKTIHQNTPPASLPVVTPLENVTASVYRPVRANNDVSLRKFELFTEDELIAQAKRYFFKMKYELAIENYSQVLMVNHQHKQVYFLIAECYSKLGQQGQAQLMEDIGKSIPSATAKPLTVNQAHHDNNDGYQVPAQNKNITLKKARELCDEKKYLEAQALYMELFDQASEDPEVLLGLGWTLNKQKKHKEAVRYFELSIAFSKTPLAYQGILQCYIFLNQLDRALDYVYDGLDHFPWSKTLLRSKENIETRLAANKIVHKPTAIPVLTGFHPKPSTSGKKKEVPTEIITYQAADKSPASSSTRANERLSEVDKIAFERALKISKEYRDAGNASIMLKKLHESYPNHIEILNELGWCMHVLKLNTDAIAYFKKSLTIANSHSAYYSLTRCYDFQNQYSLALATLDKGLRYYPNSEKLLAYKEKISQSPKKKQSIK